MENDPKPTWSQTRIIALVAIAFVALVGVIFGLARIIGGGPEEGTPSPGETPVPIVVNVPPTEQAASSLTIQLSEGQEQPEEVVPLPATSGEPLSDEEAEAVISRLPDIETEPEDEVEFRLPDEVIPPPRPGETIDETFPPEEAAPGPEAIEPGPLEVLRYSPEGEIPIAPFVNVTFNQPMVPLTTLEDLSEKDVPVQIEPDLEGTWRWLGTKTLNFQYDSELIDRMPMSTQYTVTIPAGIESAVGGVLEETIQFTFSTPTVTLDRYYPSNDPQPLDPIFFASFDQRIDPQAVLDTIVVTADNQEISIKLATDEEIKKDEIVSNLIEHTQESRWLAFKALQSLPKDASISVAIGPGTPSAEGPLLSESAQYFGFRTYAPLTVDDYGCSWYDEDCPPLTPFYIRFNNPLDGEKFDAGMLTIEPEIPAVTAGIYGNTITIRGATEGRTTYNITVSADITDIFGQTLGESERLRFRVGSAQPILMGPDQIFITLDPSAQEPALSLYSINYSKLDLQIYAVEPTDWPDFLNYLYEYRRTDTPPDPPGKLLVDETRSFEVTEDTLTELSIDLDKYMSGNYGHFIVIASPHRSLFDTEDRYWETIQVWTQITQIGVDAFVDHSEMIVWTTALENGEPLSGVKIDPQPSGQRYTTGDDGMIRFDIPAGGTTYLVASKGSDEAILPNSLSYYEDSGWTVRSVPDQLRWYVFDDRQMYRPGEEVHFKGWLRKIGGGQDGDVGLVGSQVSQVNYSITGPQGNELGNGSVQVNALGGFDFVFDIPDNANLGYAQVRFNASGSLSNIERNGYNYSFQIQEFRRPEFEVTARNETTGPYFVGDHAIVAVEAKYYAGDPLPNADVSWYVNSSPSSYQPPNWPDFTFGRWTPWWYYYYEEPTSGGYQTQSYTGLTDATGNHYLRIDFGQTELTQPFSVMAESTVMDVNRQAWSSSTSLLVHPAELYVGLRSERYFVERGTPLKIDLIVTDLDGNPVVDRPILVSAARVEWKFVEGNWKQVDADVQECTVGSQEEPVSCEFETPLGGRYRITATINDAMGRQNQSQFIRWVSGGEQRPSREVEKEEVTLIPDKDSYQPGDVAEILVQPPFTPAEGLLTVSRSGILYTQSFTIDEGSITLKVPIEEEYIPNLFVQVDVVGDAARTDNEGQVIEGIPPRPAYASGQLNLSVPPLERTLKLDVSPQETELEPGGETVVDLALVDAGGDPVADAEVAVVVVDEAILALTNYDIPDPVSIFYSQRGSDLGSYYGRSSIVLVDPMTLIDTANAAGELQALPTGAALRGVEEAEGLAVEAPMAAEPMEEMAADEAKAGGAVGAEPIRMRIDFNPLATFAPAVRTDQSGKAQVTVTLPDNLTRYRIMVVAVDSGGSRFGMAEANLTARLPLMVRPSAPRFLNFGDSFELPVVLQNQTDDPLTVDVVMRTSNLILSDGQGQRVEVPAHNRIEVRFPANTDSAGTARVQIAAVSGDFADAATVEMPVYTPATTEAFATYGVIDQGAIAQPVEAPQDVFPQFGGLEITTSSTALQALTDAVLYLVAYPYECSEQLASRVLGIAALRDVLTAFEAEGLPPAEDIEAAVVRDIERLGGLQNNDGGFPYWRRGQDSIPFNTIHVAHALQRAKLKGYEVPEDMQQRLLYYLQDIESHYPYWYSMRTRQTLSAYALYVRNLMGDRDTAKARALLEEAGIENLSLDAVGWIWQTLVDDPNSAAELEAIRLFVNNRVVETAGAANFTTYYDDQTYLLLSSNRRTDAILLDTLILDNPDSDLIPKLVNGLLAHRTKGRWGNTQENVFVLLALDRYFNTFEAQTPDFVARIWLGDTYAGEHEYEGYSDERHETDIPMAYLVDEELGGGGTQDLILSKIGTGRLYYRLGLSYAPTDLWLDPLDMGFVVTREYEGADDPDDVWKDEQGIWHAKAGARVRVRITMVADNRRYHVALVDPLPAGLEIVNPALAVSGSVPQDPSSSEYRYGWWWWWTWYEHQNMRDERAEAFTPLLWDGVYTYSYVTRATTPGTFVVPPAKAEEMYSPEVFGRSASDWFIVE